jgi:hypothetical protein
MAFERFDTNLDIRKHLEKIGYVGKGTPITPEDYKTIESRANVLIREASERGTVLTEEDAVPMAYFDRMMLQGQIGVNEIIDTIEPDELRTLLSTYSGQTYTTEESEALVRYLRSHAEKPGAVLTNLLNGWIEERAAVETTESDIAVVDGQNVVLGTGPDKHQLIRKALEE